jgi:hypothetical protein
VVMAALGLDPMAQRPLGPPPPAQPSVESIVYDGSDMLQNFSVITFAVAVLCLAYAFILYSQRHKKAAAKREEAPKPKLTSTSRVESSKPKRTLASSSLSSCSSVLNDNSAVKTNKESRPSPSESKVTTYTYKFKPFNPDLLGSTFLDDAIREYNHYIAFYYIGNLESGRKYSIMIGSSDEWVNILTLNRASVATYESYGFSILEKRWSYGNKVLGARQFREFISENMEEIVALMKTQSSVREEKKQAREAEDARIEREQIMREQQEEARQKQIKTIMSERKPVIQQYFTGMSFELNKNKRNHARAQRQAEQHYSNINIDAQTCNCKDFQDVTSHFELFDVRRLCSHLYYAIWLNNLLKSKTDCLDNFVLHNIRRDFWGIYFFANDDNDRFAIIAYRDWIGLDIAMPKNNGEGYVMSRWKFEDGDWLGSGGSKRFQQIVRIKLENLFGGKK